MLGLVEEWDLVAALEDEELLFPVPLVEGAVILFLWEIPFRVKIWRGRARPARGLEGVGLDAPKPSNSSGHSLVGDPEPLRDGQAAHFNLLKLNGLRRDFLIDWRGARVQNRNFKRDLRKGSNSLRACPPSQRIRTS